MDMMRKATRIAAVLAFAMTAAQGASAQFIAGWDFSQIAADGVAPGALAANYVKPGTSGTATVASGTVVASAMQPATNLGTATGIMSGLTAPTKLAAGETATFNAFATLRQAGQAKTEFFGLTAKNAASIQFAANAASPVSGWVVSFGGRAIPDRGDVASDGQTTVSVSFGTTCGATAPVGTAVLDSVDRAFAFNLGGVNTATGCVVLGVDGTADQPLIDNVAVPEPGAVAMMAVGVLGLAGLAQRRRA
jgi:hypothetical protein